MTSERSWTLALGRAPGHPWDSGREISLAGFTRGLGTQRAHRRVQTPHFTVSDTSVLGAGATSPRPTGLSQGAGCLMLSPGQETPPHL